VVRILYIVNRAALGGRGSDAWERFRAQWPDSLDEADVRMTDRPGHARQIAATAEGYEIIVAAGGDGTAGEVLSGIMQHDPPRPKLAVIPSGTGNDIARNVGIGTVRQAAAALQEGHAGNFDLIRVDCRVDGDPAHRYAFLSANIGFTAAVVTKLKPWMRRVLTPKSAYFLAAFRALASSRPLQTIVRWEGGQYDGRAWMIIVGNAPRQGGGMHVSPGALTDDGQLNVTIVPGVSRAKVLRKMPKIAGGSHVEEPEVSYFPVTKIEVDADPPADLEIDGDLFGTTPAVLTVCPQAVQIVCPQGGLSPTS